MLFSTHSHILMQEFHNDIFKEQIAFYKMDSKIEICC